MTTYFPWSALVLLLVLVRQLQDAVRVKDLIYKQKTYTDARAPTSDDCKRLAAEAAAKLVTVADILNATPLQS
jgi:hypothetical protein